MENIQTKLDKKIEELSVQLNGLNETARKEIIRMVTIGYLDGYSDGMKFSQDNLKETFK